MFHLALVCCGLLAAMPADSPTPEDVSAYQAAAASAGRDAEAHVRLASWCEAHGLQIERHKHLAIALEIDPDHATAHGLLGQVSDKGEWRMPEAVTEDYRGDAAAKATLARYHARRDKSPDTAQAQWQLAEWCEQNGLKAEATRPLDGCRPTQPGAGRGLEETRISQAKRPVDHGRAGRGRARRGRRAPQGRRAVASTAAEVERVAGEEDQACRGRGGDGGGARPAGRAVDLEGLHRGWTR